MKALGAKRIVIGDLMEVCKLSEGPAQAGSLQSAFLSMVKSVHGVLRLPVHFPEAAIKAFTELSREEAEKQGVNPLLGALVPGHVT